MARLDRWPTPTAKLDRAGADRIGRPRLSGGGGPDLLTAVHADLGLIDDGSEPTPSGLWPTPIASEARQGYQHRHDGARGTTESLTTRAAQAEGVQSGALNPEWVEWLMGFPIGWTDLVVDEPVVLVGEPWPPDPHPATPRIRAKVPGRKHRLRQLGNAVVPKVAEIVGRRLLELLAEQEGSGA